MPGSARPGTLPGLPHFSQKPLDSLHNNAGGVCDMTAMGCDPEQAR
jgi:hypothetical protein